MEQQSFRLDDLSTDLLDEARRRGFSPSEFVQCSLKLAALVASVEGTETLPDADASRDEMMAYGEERYPDQEMPKRE